MNATISPCHSRFLRVGDVARLAGVCTKTIRRWDKNGRLKPSHRTAGNHRRYAKVEVLVFLRDGGWDAGHTPIPSTRPGAAIYSKVSSSRQRQSGELARQEELVREHCKAKGYRVSGVYSDVGSGLNDNRKGLLKLLRDVTRGKHDIVVVNYQDRLSRFGLNVIKEHLAGWDVSLEVIHPTVVDGTPHAALITDLTAIPYSFMCPLYRSRRGKKAAGGKGCG
jgi:predicted site-specific integrase-resolvase